MIAAGEVLSVREWGGRCSVRANSLQRQSKRKQKEKERAEEYQGWGQRRSSKCSVEKELMARLVRTHMMEQICTAGCGEPTSEQRKNVTKNCQQRERNLFCLELPYFCFLLPESIIILLVSFPQIKSPLPVVPMAVIHKQTLFLSQPMNIFISFFFFSYLFSFVWPKREEESVNSWVEVLLLAKDSLLEKSAKYKFDSGSVHVYISAKRFTHYPLDLTPIIESWCQHSFFSLQPLLL